MLPRNNMDKIFTNIWQEVLKIDKIGIYDNFFDIGGNSLLAVQLVHRINEKMSSHYPTVFVFSNPTIEQQVKYYLENNTSGLLINLNKSSHQAPYLFIVHPGGAGAEVYFPLVKHLGENISVYGIDSNNLKLNSKEITNLVKLAELYALEIKKKINQGHCYLAGWSFGGLIAYEIANCLKEKGIDVNHIFMIDTALPYREVDPISNEKFSLLMKYLKLHNFEKKNFPKQYITRANKTISIEEKMRKLYTINPYKGAVTLFKASERNIITRSEKNAINLLANKYDEKEDINLLVDEYNEIQRKCIKLDTDVSEWKKFVGNLKIIKVVGNHGTIMEGRNLKIIAKEINRTIYIAEK